jgi:hypothetical protein
MTRPRSVLSVPHGEVERDAMVLVLGLPNRAHSQTKKAGIGATEGIARVIVVEEVRANELAKLLVFRA